MRRDSKLEPQTKIFRITDFFSVAQALGRQRLHLTQVSTYSDPNEGVDRLVKQLFMAASGPGCGAFGVHDSKSAELHVTKERQSRYVSCWSTNAESHAMWGMYSPDQCSIRLQTTVDKLQKLCAYAQAESLMKAVDATNDDPSDAVICEADVESVVYDDVHKLLNRLARRTRLARRVVKKTTPRFTEESATVQKKESRWREYLKSSLTLKDEAYKYEAEIRATVRFGWEPGLRAQLLRADFKEALTADLERLRVNLWVIKPTHAAPKERMPASYSAPLLKGFFETACVDPRASKHKRAFIESYLEDAGIELVISKAYGLSYMELSAYPDATGEPSI